jgi:hypothetical protein
MRTIFSRLAAQIVKWEAPWRTDRIYRGLSSERNFSAGDMQAMDIYSELERFVADNPYDSRDQAWLFLSGHCHHGRSYH